MDIEYQICTHIHTFDRVETTERQTGYRLYTYDVRIRKSDYKIMTMLNEHILLILPLYILCTLCQWIQLALSWLLFNISHNIRCIYVFDFHSRRLVFVGRTFLYVCLRLLIFNSLQTTISTQRLMMSFCVTLLMAPLNHGCQRSFTTIDTTVSGSIFIIIIMWWRRYETDRFLLSYVCMWSRMIYTTIYEPV